MAQELQLKKRGYDNLFQVCVNYYNTKLNTKLNDMPFENTEFYSGHQIYSLQLVIKDWADSGELTLDFDYKTDDYQEFEIEKMYDQLNHIIKQILASPDISTGRLSLASESESNYLINEFNNQGAEYPQSTVSQLFEEQVRQAPDQVAINFEGAELTYRQLNEKSNQLARLLKLKGVNQATIVGLMTAHSLETVVGILGIIKAGGAYLPISPDYPAERINYILNDSKVSLLLTNRPVPGELSLYGEVIDLRDQALYGGESGNLGVNCHAGDIVYVIYTSGSTGRPKGVMVEHGGLTNYILWAKKMYVRDGVEVFPLYSSRAFDLTVTSIFTPLISGGRIVVYDDNGAEFILDKIMRYNLATIVKLTPSHLYLLREHEYQNSSVKRFIVGGEDLKVDLASAIYKNFGGNIEIYNEYGPTETAVGCMIHRFDVEKDMRLSVPIGVPVDNVQIYILDQDLNPLPVGVPGEIYISGAGVSRGYLNQLGLTQECFRPNPFIAGARIYKTGDLVRHIGKMVLNI